MGHSTVNYLECELTPNRDWDNTEVEIREPQQLLLGFSELETSPASVRVPAGYKGLTAFHKYWGKKPPEPLAFLVESLTSQGDVVVDPFVGGSLIAREAALLGRRFIGIDINPVAIELGRLFLDLPSSSAFDSVIAEVARTTKTEIEEAYVMEDGGIASHYLWKRRELQAVWRMSNGRSRQEFAPTAFDLEQSAHYETYQPTSVRSPHFFQNSRINARSDLTLRDLFAGRALRSIDLLHRAAMEQDQPLRRALLLCLTAASGQMSRMVFAIKNRGKNRGSSRTRVEVGSWAIGFWRPALHFEVNPWNCFFNKARKLQKALRELPFISLPPVSSDVNAVVAGQAGAALCKADAREALAKLPTASVQLVVTDPPHSDRIPYLELSELWNAILNKEPDFSKEIVVSNATGRSRGKSRYTADMLAALAECARVVRPGGFVVLLFNARDPASWNSIDQFLRGDDLLRYVGRFPLAYSAGSLVQDNRRGALRQDYALVLRKPSASGHHAIARLRALDGWSDKLPPKTGD
jgi:SAM-dependent methyltransferase